MTKRIKTGGRTVGTVNKTSSETKELLQKIVSNELEGIAERLEQISDKERIDAVIKLMAFIIPKQSEIAVEAKMNQIDLSTMTTAELVERAKAIKDAN